MLDGVTQYGSLIFTYVGVNDAILFDGASSNKHQITLVESVHTH